jgi:hypothetical protein
VSFLALMRSPNRLRHSPLIGANRKRPDDFLLAPFDPKSEVNLHTLRGCKKPNDLSLRQVMPGAGLGTKQNPALRMKARLLPFGFGLLLQPQNMCA